MTLSEIVERVQNMAGAIKVPLLADRHEPSMESTVNSGSEYVSPQFEGEAIITVGRAAEFARQGRAQAVCLFKALSAAMTAVQRGEKNSDTLKILMKNTIATYPLAKIDYISIADPQTLNEVKMIKPGSLLSLAVFIEKVRLIDNMSVDWRDH